MFLAEYSTQRHYSLLFRVGDAYILTVHFSSFFTILVWKGKKTSKLLVYRISCLVAKIKISAAYLCSFKCTLFFVKLLLKMVFIRWHVFIIGKITGIVGTRKICVCGGEMMKMDGWTAWDEWMRVHLFISCILTPLSPVLCLSMIVLGKGNDWWWWIATQLDTLFFSSKFVLHTYIFFSFRSEKGCINKSPSSQRSVISVWLLCNSSESNQLCKQQQK